MSRSIGVQCPFCRSRMWVNGMRQPTERLKQMTATCQNPKCLASVAVNLEINHIIRPSLKPAPEIADQTLPTNGVLL